MSYWISLRHPETGEIPEVKSFEEGGTYCVSGSTEADLNITYNYAKHFNFRSLHGLKAKNTIKKMQKAIKKLGTEKDSNYWASTPGNTGFAINMLLSWAKQYPDYLWDVN